MQTIYISVNNNVFNNIENWAYEPIDNINIPIQVNEDDLDKINNFKQLCFYKDSKFYFNAEKQSDEILMALKKEKIEILNQNYAKSLTLSIANGFTFKIDLRSKLGDRLLEIIKNSLGSYEDEIKGQKTTTFFVNIEEGSGQKQIICNCLNWIWQYIFEDLISYLKITKQIKENLISSINSSSLAELENIKLNFPKPDGIKINISKTIKILLEIIDDVSLDGNRITIPEYVKIAIREVNRELFRYSKQEELEKDIAGIMINSWFE